MSAFTNVRLLVVTSATQGGQSRSLSSLPRLGVSSGTVEAKVLP